MKEGYLLINKPEGITSYDVIRRLKPILGKKSKIGHAGTLDPFASGLMIIACGRPFTKKIDSFQALPKTYTFTMIFGKETDTLDCDGTITNEIDVPTLSLESLSKVSTTFKGEQQQVPPQFSAKKKNGQRAYKLARKGETVELDANTITIHEIELLSFQEGPFPSASFTINCSKGTYVRSLVRDIAAASNTIAYTNTLSRTAIGPYTIEKATNLDQITEENIQSLFFYDSPK